MASLSVTCNGVWGVEDVEAEAREEHEAEHVPASLGQKGD